MKVFPVVASKISAPSFSDDWDGRVFSISANKGTLIVAVDDGRLVVGKSVVHLHTKKRVYVYGSMKPIGKDRLVTAGEVIGTINKWERLNFEVREDGVPIDPYGMLAGAPSLNIPSVALLPAIIKYAGIAASGAGLGYILSKVAFKVSEEFHAPKLRPRTEQPDPQQRKSRPSHRSSSLRGNRDSTPLRAAKAAVPDAQRAADADLRPGTSSRHHKRSIRPVPDTAPERVKKRVSDAPKKSKTKPNSS
jgi:hypothetical protein